MSLLDKKSSRRIVREKVLQVLYAYEMNRDNLDMVFNGMFADITSEPDRTFGRELVYKTIAQAKEHDKIIQKTVSNWELDRIALIDRLILRLGITEFLFFNDIPTKVTINEAIELAKEFSTADSNKFINGVLDRLLEKFTAENKIQKTGRGLADGSKNA